MSMAGKRYYGADVPRSTGPHPCPVEDERTAIKKQLRELTFRWTSYEDIPGSQKAECREIGKKLWHLGGMQLMQEAYYEAKDANRAASSIQPFWDGVGDWRW